MVSKRLGKGLDALISSYTTEDRYIDGAVLISKIIPNRNQPRQDFNLNDMDDLISSIKVNGILQPLTVRELDSGEYELIAGERRLRAAVQAGLETVPVYILSISTDIEMMEYALIENIQRVDLNPIEEAEGYAMLHGKFNLSQENIAKRVGKSRSAITNSLRLLKLPKEIKSSIILGNISAGHARAILSLKNSINMITFYNKIIREGLSVRQTELLVKQFVNKPIEKIKLKKYYPPSSDINNIENILISHLGTKVTIKKNNKDKGKIYIEFYSKEDLTRIVEILNRT